MTPFRVVSGLVVVLGGCMFSQIAIAEEMPTSGTFEGYYHRDRLGVGQFDIFDVAPELHGTLAKHVDKLIRLEVTNAEQRLDAGAATILAVGRIEELPPPDAKITVETKPSPVITGQPFEVIVRISDTRPKKPGETPPLLKLAGIQVSLRQPRAEPARGIGEQSPMIVIQPRWQSPVSVCEGRVDLPFPAGRANIVAGSGKMALLPGDSWAQVVTFPAGSARVDGELQASATCFRAGEESLPDAYMPIENWQAISVRLDAPPGRALAAPTNAAPTNARLRQKDIDLTPAGEGDWSDLRFTLQPVGESKPRVPVNMNPDGKVDSQTYAALGRLEGFRADGTPVELEVRRTLKLDRTDMVRSRLAELPQDGAVVTARFRTRSRFASDLARLTIGFVTEAGVETLALGDKYIDPSAAPATPFGLVNNGVKLRIRPAATTFAAGAPATFHLQAVNDTGAPIYWRTSSRRCGDNVVIAIDSATVQLPAEKAEFVAGWGGSSMTKDPEEWTITLPKTIRLAKGRHTLRYTIHSSGGTFPNACQQLVPVLDGSIASNEAVFTVE